MSCSNDEFLLREVKEWDGRSTHIDSDLAAGLLSNPLLQFEPSSAC